MNSESSNIQQNGKRKKNQPYKPGSYLQNKPYKKFPATRYYGSPNTDESNYRPRFQSDESYNYTEGNKHGEIFSQMTPNMYGYMYPGQLQKMNQKITSFSSGLRHQKKFKSAISTANNLRPHKLNYWEDSYTFEHAHVENLTGRYPMGTIFQTDHLEFIGSAE